MTQLTLDQQRRFQKAHRRFVIGVLIALMYCGGVGLAAQFVSLEPVGLLVTLGIFVVTGIVLWCMFGYRCPACGTTPRARVWSVGGGEVTYSSMVALFPRECSGCGIQLDARPRD